MLGVIAVESTDLFSSAHTGGWLGQLLSLLGVGSEKIAELNHLLRKTGHCVGYGFLSFVVFRAFRGTYRFLHYGYDGWRSSRVTADLGAAAFSMLWRVQWAVAGLVGCALVATADEVHQMSLPSRTGTWWDVLLDTSAGFVAQLLVYAANRYKAQRIARAAGAR